MLNVRIARWTLPLVFVALATTACAPGLHSVRLRTADGRERKTVPRPRPPVALPDKDFQRATASLAHDVVPVADPLEFARQRFEVPVRSGWYLFNPRTKKITPLDDATAAGALPADVVELTRSYLLWCHNRREPGDCLRILRKGYVLDGDGRYAVAMAIALGSILDETRASLMGMADPVELEAMVVCAMTMYLMLWALPEPVSKGIAAIMTASLVVYLGVDTLYTLGRGWKELIDRADVATTFDELQQAGEKFGKVMGANTARILVMLATAVLGSQSGALVKAAPNLPRAAQASRVAATEGGVTLAAVGEVESATLSESGVTLTLAPGEVADAVAEGGALAEGEAAATEAEAAAKPYPVPGNIEDPALRRMAKRMYYAIRDHLKPSDLEGAWRDRHGNPVPNPSIPGGYYDHLGEVEDALQALRNTVEGFKGALENPALSAGDRSIIQEMLTSASKTLDYLEKVITRDQWFPGTRIPYP